MRGVEFLCVSTSGSVLEPMCSGQTSNEGDLIKHVGRACSSTSTTMLWTEALKGPNGLNKGLHMENAQFKLNTRSNHQSYVRIYEIREIPRTKTSNRTMHQ